MVRKIGDVPPGTETVKALIENAGKVTPVEKGEAARDFHDAVESAKSRAASEADANAKINKSSGKKTPSFDDVDPEIQRQLRDAGYTPPKP